MWRAWKAMTVWIGPADRAQVDLAMDRASRGQVRWRWRVWGAAWIVAVVAWTPLAMVLGLTLPSSIPEWLIGTILYGPLVVAGSLALGCIVAGVLGPPVPLVVTTPDAKNRERRAIVEWRVVGAVGLSLFILGQLLR